MDIKFIPVEEVFENHSNTVLIVDDEKDICYSLSLQLRKRNMASTYVGTKHEARIELSNSRPIILFLDNHLPDGFGVDLVREIKKEHPNTYIIMISAYDGDDEKALAYREGVDYFLSKPFSIKEVNTVIDTILKNRKNG